MIKFYYTMFQTNKIEEFKDEDLDYVLSLMSEHFYEGYSCAQMVVDFDNLKIYLLIEDLWEDVLSERGGYLGFSTNNFTIVIVNDDNREITNIEEFTKGVTCH